MTGYRALLVLIFLTVTILSHGIRVCAEERAVTDTAGNVVLDYVDPDDIPRLIDLLGHEDGHVRAQSEELLVEFGGDAVPALIEALGRDDTGRPRIMAVLTAIRDERAVAPISMFLADKDKEVSGAARGSLVGFGETASYYMAGLLQDERLRDASSDVLINIKPSREAISLARKLIGNDIPATRAAAAHVLGLWDDVDSTESIKQLVFDKEPTVRAKALSAYGRLAGKNGDIDHGLLLGLLGDESAEVRISAVRLLSSAPGEDIIGPLTKLALNDPDGDVRDNALSALGNTGDPKVAPVLIKGLGDTHENSVISSLWYLDDLGAKEAVPHILALFKGDGLRANELLVEEACHALAGLKQPVDLKIFLPYLDVERAYETRLAVLELVAAVGEPGDSGLIASLEDYRSRENNSSILLRYEDVLDALR